MAKCPDCKGERYKADLGVCLDCRGSGCTVTEEQARTPLASLESPVVMSRAAPALQVGQPCPSCGKKVTMHTVAKTRKEYEDLKKARKS